ncbi:HAD-IIA family hydrolase [Paenibacillus sedimenti]|uniref:Acid sugar phosphatase n=1 Tax=Paenibacillus sedimenti TaxID=2770274 RepID=A0A926KN04_9BACL|nr:HAD-IIA family hydrolase [Paenibacillus sedimenti]MBD0379966.1 HAD-IIA family hydrolase [Paenibacillus sedimenti]
MKDLLTSFDAYCFDLDGTIFVGDSLLPGVLSTITELRKSHKKIMFLTNTSTQTRYDCQKRLERMGLFSDVEEIITASYLAGVFFKEHAPDASVLVIGERAMEEELQFFDVSTTVDPLEASHVLVGLDRAFNYEKLHIGMKAVRRGAKLIAANPDPCCPIPGDVIPDTGALLKALEVASQTEVELVIGKPSIFYANQALQRLGIPSGQCLMVGDRLETDILLGMNSGMKTALVLTGIATRDDIEAKSIRPDYVINTLSELIVGKNLILRD